MPSLKEVRNRINSVKSTQQITKAMKMVSAAKLRKAQDAIIKMRPYAQLLNKIIQNLSASNTDGEVRSVYTEEREPNRVLIIAITSDRGLCGAFNSNIIKTSVNLAQEKYAPQFAAGNVSFLTIGNKGYDSIRKRGLKIIGTYATLFHNLNFQSVKEAGEYILNAFANKELDRVEIIFNEFKNVATQIIRVQQFLPIVQDTTQTQTVSSTNNDYILEPSQAEIIQELIPKSLKIQLYRAILESNASEHGARMTAMDKATENADSLVKDLTLVYNRTRQAAITKEILEIVGGAEALKGE
ncbi:MAG: ATP synthase F1 subunit gamma [Microscillaceae bacterium]|jgi:F-type H+-transporting ATPase subunit gamma|nr:ATP synthase F1 subunit gamma [Microscillaceae bacterium]